MKIATGTYRACALAGLLAVSQGLSADWGDLLKSLDEKVTGGTTSGGAAALSSTDISAGLKEALTTGTRRAIGLLGQDGGFMNDGTVKILLPDSLQTVEKGLRLAGQGAVVDEFVATMNQAAEKAVPATTDILVDTISGMSLQDAQGILNGPDDAATRYFREHSEEQLTTAILPIVENATSQTGVTAAYKKMTGGAGLVGQLSAQSGLDVDRYVAGKTLDGLFVKLAAEEKLIRENPMARSTDLLKKVFGR